MTDRVRIVDPDPRIEEILAKLDDQRNQTIYAADGVTPLYEPIVDDRTITYAKDGESVSIDPEEFLMRAARMQRDGMSLKAIHAELDLKNVSMATLEAALRLGHQWLDEAIASGREPEESVRVLGYRDVAEDDTNEHGVAEALDVGRRLVADWQVRE